MYPAWEDVFQCTNQCTNHAQGRSTHDWNLLNIMLWFWSTITGPYVYDLANHISIFWDICQHIYLAINFVWREVHVVSVRDFIWQGMSAVICWSTAWTHLQPTATYRNICLPMKNWQIDEKRNFIHKSV